MNFLSIFVLIPLLMLAGLWAARGIKAIRGVMVTGASALLIASVVLTFMYLGERSAGNTAECYSVRIHSGMHRFTSPTR